ncbi:hypothetical protein ABPG75_004474 [Micractinium tetrahymenae]
MAARQPRPPSAGRSGSLRANSLPLERPEDAYAEVDEACDKLSQVLSDLCAAKADLLAGSGAEEARRLKLAAATALEDVARMLRTQGPAAAIAEEIVEDDISALEESGRAVHLSASPAGSPRSPPEQSPAEVGRSPAGTPGSPISLSPREKHSAAGSAGAVGSPKLRTPRMAEVQAMVLAMPGSPRSPTAREGNAERTL